jgi:hypothetical protein
MCGVITVPASVGWLSTRVFPLFMPGTRNVVLPGAILVQMCCLLISQPKRQRIVQDDEARQPASNHAESSARCLLFKAFSNQCTRPVTIQRLGALPTQPQEQSSTCYSDARCRADYPCAAWCGSSLNRMAVPFVPVYEVVEAQCCSCPCLRRPARSGERWFDPAC